jgi:hypothetical protein
MRKLISAIGLLLVACALDGPLFPWSPVKSGYSRYALEHMIRTRGLFPEYFNVSFDGAVREFQAALR